MAHSASLPAPPGTEIHPVTEENWADLETLFGPHGAFMGCWCAYWRLRHREFNGTSAAEHREVLHGRACSDSPPGLLAYRDGEPVAWVSVEPRENFAAFEHARVYKAVDDTPVWAVTCFYQREDVRGTGLTTHLLRAVKEHVRASGGTAVEGYPEDPDNLADSGTPGFMGIVPAFEHAGFEEVERLSNGRPVYRAMV
jgi:GNAT superfamily N-acetyltransferase